LLSNVVVISEPKATEIRHAKYEVCSGHPALSHERSLSILDQRGGPNDTKKEHAERGVKVI